MSGATGWPFSFDRFRLDGRTALVTGAGSGLGRVFARALATAGAHVLCADIAFEAVEETTRMISAAGGNASSHALDVADADAVAALVAGWAQGGTAVDILVNNAGIACAANRLHEMPVSDWDKVQAVNLRGTFLCARAVLPGMLERRRGVIINLASIAGLLGVAHELSAVAAHYSASKGAVIALTRQIAVEYGRDGIRCNAIAPGWHLGTNLGRAALPAGENALKALVAALDGDTPMGRTGHPEELAGLAVYLASDASSFVTGQIIAHDGGWSAW